VKKKSFTLKYGILRKIAVFVVATFALFSMSDVFAQTVKYQYGFESTGESYTAPTASMSTGTSGLTTTLPRTGLRDQYILDNGGGSKAIDGSIITSQISFTAGMYYVITAYIYTSGGPGKLSFYKNSTATNAAMKASSGGDVISAPASNNLTSASYIAISGGFLASSSETKYVGFQFLESGASTTFLIDDIIITEYSDPQCANYCSVTGSAAGNAFYFTNVTFNTINRTSVFDSPGYICTGSSTTVEKSSSYNLDVTYKNASGLTYTLWTAAWIDYNRDGDFADAGENVMSSTSASVASLATANRVQSVAIPSGATTGLTKMRIVVKYSATLAGPCDPYTSNIEWEDYDINIIAGCTPPAAPTGSASQTFCSGASPTVANLAATGTAIQWYAASSGGSPLATSTALVNNIHYYATQTVSGCESTSRLDVTATVNTTPAAPTGSVSQSFCSAASPTVANLAATGTTIQWYAASSGGSPLATSTALVNNIHYYATQTVSGCESTTRFDMVATVNTPPSVTVHPVDVTMCQNGNTSFSVTATGTNPTYQWQYSSDNGTSWYDITAAGSTPAYSNWTTSALGLSGADNPVNGYKYRCVVSVASCSSVNSNAAILTVNPASDPIPDGNFSCTPSPILLSASGAVSGEKYLWYSDLTGGTLLKTSTDENDNTYTTPSISTTTTYYVTIKITTSGCESYPRLPVVASIYTAPSVTTPPSNSTVAAGNNTSFSVAATGTLLTYQWQLSTNGGSTWNDQVDGGIYSNMTTATMNIIGATAGMTGYKYRCVINGSCSPSATSNSATLTIGACPATPASISGNTGVCSGATGVVYSIASVPDATTYTWSVPSGATINAGQTTTSITVTFGSTSGNVSVTAGNGTCTSSPQTLAITVGNNGSGVWTGAVNTDWFNSGNWCGLPSPYYPTSTTDVYIPSATQCPNQPYINGDVYSVWARCRNLVIAQGATLTDKQYGNVMAQGIGWGVQPDGCLLIYGNLQNDGTLDIRGHYKNGNYRIWPTYFMGTNAQTISGNGYYPEWQMFHGPVFQFYLNSDYTLMNNWPPQDCDTLGGIGIGYAGYTTGSLKINDKTVKTSYWNQYGTSVVTSGTLKIVCNWDNFEGAVMYCVPALSTWGTNSLMMYAKKKATVDFAWNDDYYNLEMAPSVGAYDYSIKTDMSINGYFKITDGLVYGAYPFNNNSFSLKGDWINNGTYNPYNYSSSTTGASTVIFNGSVTQHITSTKSPKTSTTFHNLTNNNSQDVNAVVLDVNTTVGTTSTDAGVLTLTNGDIQSTASELLTLNSAVTVSPSIATGSGQSGSFVSGFLNRTTSTTNGVTYDYPMGDSPSGTWRPMAITTKDISANTWLCQMIKTNPNTALGSAVKGSPELITGMNNVYYYNLTRSGMATIDLKMFYVEADQPSISESDFIIGHWVSGSSYWDNWTKNSPSDWVYDATNNWMKVIGVSSFSPVGPGNKKTNLPIELLTFNAKCQDNQVNLSWVTTSETNNDFFTIERSGNSTEWENLFNVQGAGNSNSYLFYTAEDKQPLSGNSYYRLKQTDFDGKYSYSDVVEVDCSSGTSFELISMISDANASEIIMTFIASEGDNYNFSMFDTKGQRILQKSEKAIAGTNEIHIKTNNLSQGIYLISLQNSEKYFGQKIFLK